MGAGGVFAVRLRKGFLFCFVVTNVTSTEIKASALKCSHSDFCSSLFFLYIVVCSHKGLNQRCQGSFSGLNFAIKLL